MRPFLLLLLNFLFPSLYGQYEVRGVVVSAEDAAYFPPTSVLELGTQRGVYTDADGRFSLNVTAREVVLEFSSLGYETQEVRMLEGTPQEIRLVPSDHLMETVVVSGTWKPVSKLDSPVPVEVYAKNFFLKNPAPSVFESLQNVNGVRPQLNCNVCNTGDIHINGLEGPYTMVLIDGMPIVSGLSTVYGLTGIPRALIERMEVVKGPASTLYGSEAVGGLINLITKQPGKAPDFSADVFASDWGEVNTDLGASYGIGERLSGLVGLNYFNYQNPIDRNGDNFTDLTLQDRISVFNKVSIDRKDGKPFQIAGRYVYENRWGGEMQWTPADRGGDEVYGESILTERWETFGTYRLPGREVVDLQFSANGHRQDSYYGDLAYLADQRVGFAQLLWRKELGAVELLTGASYRYTRYDDNTPATETGASVVHLPGIFVQNEWSIDARNQLLFGLRYDRDSRHGNIVSPRLNYKWNSTNKQNILRLSVGNGYRVANVFTEDHAALTGARRVVFADELRPETSWNANLNFTKKIVGKRGNIWNLDATAFYTHFGNRILPDYETNANLIIYDNLDGNAVSRGVSLNADFAGSRGWEFNGGLTLMDVTVTENGERRQQLLTESVQGVWSIGYDFSDIGLKLDYTGNLYGPMRLPRLGPLDDRPAYSPWWSIQNIQFTKQFGKRWEIYGGVKNLLNFRPDPASIARAFDPFDRGVSFDESGNALPTPNNPKALTFDPSYVYAPNQGIRSFLGVRVEVW